MPAVALVVVKAFAAMGIAVSRQGIFWLKHHKPDEYRDVHEHKHTGELKSSETLRLEFLAEVKAVMNEGLLSEAEFAQLKPSMVRAATAMVSGLLGSGLPTNTDS